MLNKFGRMKSVVANKKSERQSLQAKEKKEDVKPTE
jgi:hypothetical protein